MKNIILFSLALLLFNAAVSQNERPKQPDLPGDFVIDFGLSLLYNSGDIENKPWKSANWGFYYMYTLKLNDYITVNPQLGFTLERYEFFNSVNYVEGDERIISWDTIADVPLAKNRLIAHYLELPLEIRFYPLKTIEGEGIFIGVGGSIGIRTNSFTKIKYSVDNDDRTATLDNRFGLENFRYGLQGRIGMKGVNAFYKIYLSNIWSEPPAGNNASTMSIGINVTGF